MALSVTLTEDPARVIDEAGMFLRADPVRNFTMLTLLRERIERPQIGRYWVAMRDGEATGIVFQSPLDFPTALITGMEPDAVDAVIEAVTEAGFPLRGVGGPSSTAKAFAERWAKVSGVTAEVAGSERIYSWPESEAIVPARYAPPAGQFRKAATADRDLLVEWMRGFHADHPHADPVQMVDTRLPAGRFWVWDDNGPVSAACQSNPLEEVVSIQAVYTPPELRNHGYATACVAALTTHIRASGHRPMLYTNTANGTANSIYHHIGYRVVDQLVRYRFASVTQNRQKIR